MGPTEELARYIAGTSYRDLPGPVVAAAKVGILDGVANLLAGSRQPAAEIVSAYVREMGGNSASSVVGWGFKTNPFFAAFANGVFLHCMDYEIQGQPASHGTSAILRPALALAETRERATGKDIIEAYALGWDVQQRIRAASAGAQLRGFHPPGIFGPMGAAAACSKIMGFDTEQVRTVLGIAGSRTGGLFANNGTMVKSTHPGNAGRVAVEAALLTRSGFISNDSILEANQGYVGALFGEAFDYGLLLQGTGKTFHLTEPGFNIKRYPAEILMQWVIDPVANLRKQHNIQLADVDRVVVELPRIGADLSRPRPASGLDGKFSFEYCGVVALVDDPVGIDSFSDETCFSPAMQLALGKVSLELNTAITRGVKVTITMRDGRRLREECRDYRGSIGNPMTREEHLVKYEDCAKRVLSPTDQLRVREMVENLEDLGDIRELMTILNRLPAQ